MQLIQPVDKYLLKHHVVDRRAVIEHLQLVLKAFANKPDFKFFYIGITSNVRARLRDHQQEKPEFSLMVPIYEEDDILVENSFDLLEREAIDKCGKTILHPDTKKILLTCKNTQSGMKPKMTLYILVG